MLLLLHLSQTDDPRNCLTHFTYAIVEEDV